jgi:hypothetical protein
MTMLPLRESQQSTPRPVGTWKLEPGRALTLHPTEAGELRVAQGRLWATFDGPHHGSLGGFGDLFVGAGETLRLKPGQRVVIEPADRRSPAFFAWELVPQTPLVPCWEPVVQSWRDLRTAVRQAGRAAAGLGSGLAAVAVALLPRRMPGSRVAA